MWSNDHTYSHMQFSCLHAHHVKTLWDKRHVKGNHPGTKTLPKSHLTAWLSFK